MSDSETFFSLDSEEPEGMSSYGARTPLQVSLNINKIINGKVRRNPVARGVDAAKTMLWTDQIMTQMTDDHVAALSAVQTKWKDATMVQKLHLMEVYRSVIEEVRPEGTAVDEIQQEDWTWSSLVSGAGTLLRLIGFMIKKAMSQGRSGDSEVSSLKEKNEDWACLLTQGLPLPPGSMRRRNGRNKNNLLASGVRSMEMLQPGWWLDVRSRIPLTTTSMSQETWIRHLAQVDEGVVWDDTLVEHGGAEESEAYAGRFNVDWLVNLAFFCRKNGHSFDRLEPLTRFLNVMSRSGPLTKAKLISAEGHYPILNEMAAQWVGEGSQ